LTRDGKIVSIRKQSKATAIYKPCLPSRAPGKVFVRSV
jgi:hypothetical protein